MPNIVYFQKANPSTADPPAKIAKNISIALSLRRTDSMRLA